MSSDLITPHHLPFEYINNTPSMKISSCAIEVQIIFFYNYVVIAGWPVQFLPPTSPLVEEALADAVTVQVEGTPARVFTAEHLAAIALQIGRPKDKARLLQFVESGAIDTGHFLAILARHDLNNRWQEFERTFLSGAK